jgi:hypothetical protein
MKIRRWAPAAAILAVAVALVGGGVRASFTDTGSAAAHVAVGTFAVQISSTDPHAVVSPDGKSVTITLPTIQSSAAGNAYVQDLTVTNTGSIPMRVHWTETTGGTLAPTQWQPSGFMGYATGTAANNMSTDLTLAAGASHTYGAGGNGVGFLWAELDNTYLGKTAQVTYTANATEVPPAPQSHIQFIGLASEAGHAALTLPAGAQAGDLALVLEQGTAIVATPTGYTNIAQPVAPRGNMAYRVLQAGDTTVPAAATTVTDMEVAIYRNASVGSHTYYSANANNVGLSGGSPLYYPLKSTPLDGVTGPAMTKTDGSSWVVCMGYDSYASTNMSQMSFNTITSAGPPYVLDGQIAANHSASNTDAHVGLADSGGGVAAWLGGAWGSPGDNFPLPGTHGVAVHTVELLSN